MTKPSPATKLTPSWDLLPKSVELVRLYFVPLLYVSLLPTLVVSLGLTVGGDFTKTDTSAQTAGLLLIVGGIWSLLAYSAFYSLQLLAAEHKTVVLSVLFKTSLKYLPRLIGLLFVYGLLIVGGLILLIVPGLIVLRRYYLAPYYLIDQDLSISESLRRSAAATRSVSGYIWGIIGVAAVFSIAGGFVGQLPEPLGTLGSVAISCLYVFAPALRYREITKHT